MGVRTAPLFGLAVGLIAVVLIERVPEPPAPAEKPEVSMGFTDGDYCADKRAVALVKDEAVRACFAPLYWCGTPCLRSASPPPSAHGSDTGALQARADEMERYYRQITSGTPRGTGGPDRWSLLVATTPGAVDSILDARNSED